jgi:agmatinase
LTGEVSGWPIRFPVVDTGDVPIFQTDIPAQIAAAAEHIHAASLTSSVTVTLGGDHFVAYPAFEGVVRAWRERTTNLKVGYLHIDSHSDFFDEITILGRYNHGTCVRRISEIDEVQRIAWFGLNGASIVEPGQFDVMRSRHFRACTAYYAHEVGIPAALSNVLDYVTDGVDILYTSIDIDVVNGAYAPATHSPVFEGLSAQELLEALRILTRVDCLVGVDLCEVAPPIETSQRTERLGALAIMTVLGHRLTEVYTTIDRAELSRVFWL